MIHAIIQLKHAAAVAICLRAGLLFGRHPRKCIELILLVKHNRCPLIGYYWNCPMCLPELHSHGAWNRLHIFWNFNPTIYLGADICLYTYLLPCVLINMGIFHLYTSLFCIYINSWKAQPSFFINTFFSPAPALHELCHSVKLCGYNASVFRETPVPGFI